MDAEVVIVGGGIVGLWTLYNLAKQGVKTILIEQFPYPHTRGSSHGQSRVTRYVYAEEEYAQMMPECFKMWKELQEEGGEEILTNTGVLRVFNMFKSEEVTAFYNNLDQMDRYAPSVDVIPGQEIESRFPGLRFDSKHKGIYDENGGLLKADKCLHLLRRLCGEHGGKIFDSEEALSIKHINDSKMEIITSKKRYFARSVILTCGAYTNKLLSTCQLTLPLTVMKSPVFYWKDTSDSECYSSHNNFPSLGYHNFYSIPSYEYPRLLKLCCYAILPVNMEEGMKFSEAEKKLENTTMVEFKKQISDHFPEIDVDGPAISEMCIFTKTPDWGFIIDHHPLHKNLVIGAGFSGHGFKTAPVVGRMLAAMSLGQQPSYSLIPFSLKRFLKHSMDSKL